MNQIRSILEEISTHGGNVCCIKSCGESLLPRLVLHTSSSPHLPLPTLQIKRAGGGSGSAGSIRPPSGPGRARSGTPYQAIPQGHAKRPKRPQSRPRETAAPPRKSEKIVSKILSNFAPFFDHQKTRKMRPMGFPRAPQNHQKCMFFMSFFQTLFFHSVWSHFGAPQPLKIVLPCRRQHDFHKIEFFKKCFSLAPFWYHFGRLFRGLDASGRHSKKR